MPRTQPFVIQSPCDRPWSWNRRKQRVSLGIRFCHMLITLNVDRNTLFLPPPTPAWMLLPPTQFNNNFLRNIGNIPWKCDRQRHITGWRLEFKKQRLVLWRQHELKRLTPEGTYGPVRHVSTLWWGDTPELCGGARESLRPGLYQCPTSVQKPGDSFSTGKHLGPPASYISYMPSTPTIHTNKPPPS